jgi:hypothetical protein
MSCVDYELVILDMIPEAGLTWRGNPNELIAGYAVRSKFLNSILPVFTKLVYVG